MTTPPKIQTPQQVRGDISAIIDAALAEDVGSGDITSQLLIPADLVGQMHFVAREPMVACGTFIPGKVYARLAADVKIDLHCTEGQGVAKSQKLLTLTGPARALLTGERVALNLMQRMCGIATVTRAYVDAVAGTKAVILDTRKTMPGLRVVDKYAVKTGGGQNHRMGLYDAVMIKDNHIALSKSIANAVVTARAGTALPIILECDTLEQVKEAIVAKPDRILLDNMDLATMRRAVELAGGHIPLEASGGVSLETVRAIAQTGVDYISVGKLTHSTPAVDIGADITIS